MRRTTLAQRNAPVDVDRLMELWTAPPAERPDPESDFARFSADPLHVNGFPLPLPALVDRAGAIHTAFSRRHITVIENVVSGDKIAE